VSRFVAAVSGARAGSGQSTMVSTRALAAAVEALSLSGHCVPARRARINPNVRPCLADGVVELDETEYGYIMS